MSQNMSSAAVVISALRVKGTYLSPFMSNGITHPYQLDVSILNLRVVGW